MSPHERDIRRFLIPVLRRASLRWKPRNEALKAARVERGQYKCAACEQIFGPKDVIVDHTEPVVPLTGDDYNWHTFVNRLLVPVEGFQILCRPCSDVKTLMEDNLRTAARQKNKELEKEAKLKEKEAKKLAKKKKME